jgi:hypothetical protein
MARAPDSQRRRETKGLDRRFVLLMSRLASVTYQSTDRANLERLAAAANAQRNTIS